MNVLVKPIADGEPMAPSTPVSSDTDALRESDAAFWLSKYVDEAYAGSDVPDAQHAASSLTSRVKQLDLSGITMGAVTSPVTWTSEKVGEKDLLPGDTKDMEWCLPTDGGIGAGIETVPLDSPPRTTESFLVIRNLIAQETSKIDASHFDKAIAPDTQTAFQNALSSGIETKFGIKNDTDKSEFVDVVNSALAAKLGNTPVIWPVYKNFDLRFPSGIHLNPGDCVISNLNVYQTLKTVTADVWQRMDGTFNFQLARDARDTTPPNVEGFQGYTVTMTPSTAISGISGGLFPDQSKNYFQPYQLASRDHLLSQTLNFPGQSFRVTTEPGQPAIVEVHRTVSVKIPMLSAEITTYVHPYRNHNIQTLIPIKPDPPFELVNPWQRDPDKLIEP
ncbi:hypothetical protein VH571_14985 [Frondihabitans sp. 4ASC-45]|uniref:hypothetical protein n=1 Tax=Frondihabitans sp. 4ASC-45 TaxID=3111636 RepID=UPI003C1CA97F